MFASLADFKPRPTRVSRAPWDDLSSVERRFPRISRELGHLWNGPHIDRYLDDLLIDTRGNRQGFPAAVLEELMFLSSLRWQMLNPEFLRADQGLIDQFTFNPEPRRPDIREKTLAWVLA